MTSTTPPLQIFKDSLARFYQEFSDYHYVKIWCLMWAVFAIVILLGGISIAKQTGNSKYPNYRLELKPFESSLTLPNIKFESVGEGNNTMQFQTFACGTESGINVPLLPCGHAPSPQKCLVTSGLVQATPTDNKLTCILATDPTDANFLVRVSATDNTPGQHLATYVHASDLVKVFLETTELHSGADIEILHSFRHEYTTLQHETGAVELQIIVPTLPGTQSWMRWMPFNGWQALGTLGGVIFFNYVFHGFVMSIVGLFYANPWSVDRRRAPHRETEKLLPYRELPDVTHAES